MSDLVERLRRYSFQPGNARRLDEQGELIFELVTDMHKAADEIERLTARNEHLEQRFGYLEGDWERRNHIIESQAKRIAELEAALKSADTIVDSHVAENAGICARDVDRFEKYIDALTVENQDLVVANEQYGQRIAELESALAKYCVVTKKVESI